MTIGHTMTETLTRADESVRAAEPLAAADPLRPVFHFRPPAQWMNNICGALWHAGWYHQYLDANGTVLPRVLNGDPHGLKLHLFYDKSVMELFINDGWQTVTHVAIPPAPALHLEAAATGGAATLRRLTAWPIKPGEENRK